MSGRCIGLYSSLFAVENAVEKSCCRGPLQQLYTTHSLSHGPISIQQLYRLYSYTAIQQLYSIHPLQHPSGREPKTQEAEGKAPTAGTHSTGHLKVMTCPLETSSLLCRRPLLRRDSSTMPFPGFVAKIQEAEVCDRSRTQLPFLRNGSLSCATAARTAGFSVICLLTRSLIAIQLRPI